MCGVDWECRWRTVGTNAEQEVVLSVFICKSLALEGGGYEESLVNFIQKICTAVLQGVQHCITYLGVQGWVITGSAGGSHSLVRKRNIQRENFSKMC